ncbi:MAG: nitroreductase [Anaerolineae bacterium]|nr:nitroreductase [Anaerolineae bacterium]
MTANTRHQQSSRLLDFVRQFNKHIYNPIMLRFVRFIPIYAVIEHVGRRSGKQYRTPVLVGRVADGFYIPLPYGDHVDWHRNVQAASGFTLTWRGRKYAMRYGRMVDEVEAITHMPRLAHRGLRRAHVKSYIKVFDASA